MLHIFLITMVLMFHGSEAILCYDCDSTSTPGCGNTLSNPGSIPTCSGTWCGIGRSATTNLAVYVRLCGQTALVPGVSACSSETVNGVQTYECVCDTADFCNAGFSANSQPPATANSQPPANVPSVAFCILATSAVAVVLAKLQG